MCLTLEGNLLASPTEIQLVLSSKCNVGAPVWSAKAYIYLQIIFVLLTSLYMHIIYTSVDSDSIYGCICNFQHTSTPIRVCIIPETELLLLRIIARSAYL